MWGRREMGEAEVNGLIDRLTGREAVEAGAGANAHVDLSLHEVTGLCGLAEKRLLEDASLLELRPPIAIAGGVHGQYQDLLAALHAGDYPPAIRSNWLFLGDYTGRGYRGLDCLCLLLALKVRFPTHVFLLRGAAEDVDPSQLRGALKEETQRRLGTGTAWRIFVPVFEAMPFAALIGQPPNRIFAVHGGISPGMKLSDVAALRRPALLPRTGLSTDLIWADVEPMIETYAESYRGISHRFGRKALYEFCARNNVSLVIRTHQVVQEGFQFFTSNLVTIWTAPKYNDELDNFGAVAVLGADGSLAMRVLVPEPGATAEEEPVAVESPKAETRPLPLEDPTMAKIAKEREQQLQQRRKASSSPARPSVSPAHPFTPRSLISGLNKANRKSPPRVPANKNRPTPLPRRRSPPSAPAPNTP